MINRKPRLLLLAHPFPPCRAIGAVRCWNIAKHLARRDWQVEVVAPAPELISNPEPDVDINHQCRDNGIICRWTQYDWRILTNGRIKSRYWGKRSYLSLILNKLAKLMEIEASIGWTQAAARACQTIQPGDVDLILASGSPFCSFPLAYKLAKRLQVPYVLDYRDPWTFNPFHNREHKKRIVTVERKITQKAAGIIVVSPPWAEQLQTRYNLAKVPVSITNGFDPDDWSMIPAHSFDDFAVVYAGRFYPPSRTIVPVIQAIAQANTESVLRPIRLHYYGKDFKHVHSAAEACNATEWCVDHGECSKLEVYAALKGAGAAAVVVDVTKDADRGFNAFLPGKLFEAIGSGAPVLVVGSPGAQAGEIVAHSESGKAFSGHQTKEIADWLLNVLNKRIIYTEGRRNMCSWPEKARQLDAFLRSLLTAKDSVLAS